MNTLERWFNSIAEGNAPHAALLCGPDAGLCELYAREAAALFTAKSKNPALLRDNPRYLELVPSGIDSLRSSLRLFRELGDSAGNRCMTIFSAHLFKVQEQNVLLKTIEEPPLNTLIILTGTEAGLLPTIRSRCMTLRLSAASESECERLLISEGTAPDLARLCAKLSDGRLFEARRYASEDYRRFRTAAVALVERLMLSHIPYGELTELLSGTSGKGKRSVDSALLSDFFDIWLSLLRDSLIKSLNCAGGRNADCAELTDKIGSRFTIAQIQGIIETVLEAQRMLGFKTNPAVTLDWALAKCKG
ncbi:MAG: hypothetical protein Q4C04_01915 [Clostridia bacterium]|nr:hypothetical protein [Clostridia bacterium]